MIQTTEKVGLDHVYFIFADNRYEGTFSNEKMKALLNFHALMYDKLVIPDTFLINNSKLVKFLQTKDNLSYLDSGIIIPSIRNGRSLNEVYETLELSGTIVQRDYSRIEMFEYLSRINLNKSIRWDLDSVAENFSVNFWSNINAIGITGEKEYKLKDLLASKKFNLKKLTRVQLMEIKLFLPELGYCRKDIENYDRYVDITYNFNLPNLMQFSATYPDLLNQTFIKPETIFLNPSATRVQNEIITKEQDIETNLFNEGILATLNFEQINHLRKQKAFKELQKIVRGQERYKDDDLHQKMITLIEMFDNELESIINSNIKKELHKEKKILALKTGAFEITNGEGVPIIQEMMNVSLGLAGDFLGLKAVGRLFNMCMRPFTQQHEQEIRNLKYHAKKQIKQTKSNRSILDTYKDFGISNMNM